MKIAAALTIVAGLCLTAAGQTTLTLPRTATAADGVWFAAHGRDLTTDALPKGELEFGDVAFKVAPGAGWLVAGDDRRPAGAIDLADGVKATHLLFLHAFDPGPALHDWRMKVALAHRKLELPPAPPTVFRYVVTYEDETTQEIPVRFEEGINQWYRVHGVGPMLWAEAAWTKDLDPVSGERAVLYAMRWPNPYPGRPVKRIAVEAQDDGNADFGDALILGVTAVRREATGDRFYVAPPPVGDDAHPGSFDEPWATLGKAAAVADAGDTVFIRGGTYSVMRRIEITNAGAPGRWLTFSAYPGEDPVFDASASRLDPGLHARTGYRDHDTGIIAALGNADWLRVQGLHVHHSRRSGITLFGNRESRGSHVEMLHNTIYRTYAMGLVTFWTDEVKVIGNRVVRPHDHSMFFQYGKGIPTATGQCPQEAIDLSRNTNYEIAFNEVYGGGKEAIDCISTDHGRIHHNYIHHCLNGIYIDCWTIPQHHIEVHHNYIHHSFSGVPVSDEGGSPGHDMDIHHNIIFLNKGPGIGVNSAGRAPESTFHSINVFNNTIDRGSRHHDGIGWHGGSLKFGGGENTRMHGCLVANNIVTRDKHCQIVTTLKDYRQHNIRVTHNLSWPAGDFFPKRQQEHPLHDKLLIITGDHAVTEDPLYVNAEGGDYRLREGSPAIDAGHPDARFNDPDGSRADIGALPHGSAWRTGFDWAGRTTAYYRGESVYEPVPIPRDRFTIHANNLEVPSWFQIGRYGADLRHLPKGEQSYAGINWFIEDDRATSHPTVIALKGTGSQSRADAVRDIPVGRRADSLCFLHVYHIGPDLRALMKQGEAEGTRLFSYIVHYADGTRREAPIRWGRQVERWRHGAEPTDLPDARLAWRVPDSQWRGHIGYLRLYAYEWANPEPRKAIRSIDIVTANTEETDYGAPAILAISTGRTPTP